MQEHGMQPDVSGSGSTPGARAAREVQLNTPLRQARTCYNHLAGVAGVALLDEMLRRGWLSACTAGERAEYQLTPEGALALAERGVDLKVAHEPGRRFAYGCPDWTEGRPHLAGALASAILAALQADGVIERRPGSRAVQQRQTLSAWLDGPARR